MVIIMNLDEEFSILFEDLRIKWRSYISNQVESSDDEEEIIFKLPEKFKNKLIFFDIPFNHYVYYREKIFPEIRKLGYSPFVENDANLPNEDINVSKLFYFIEKSYIIIIDISSSKLENFIKNQEQNKVVIYISDEDYIHNIDIPEDQVVIRPKNLDRFSKENENFINNLLNKVEILSNEQYYQYEFINYFNQENYDSAVVFAFKELELKLNEVYGEKYKPFSNYYEIIKNLAPNYVDKNWRMYRKIRNKIVHEKFSVEGSIARNIIFDIKDLLKKLDVSLQKTEVHDRKELEIFFQRHETRPSLKECFYELEKWIKEINSNVWLKIAKHSLTFNDDRVFLYVEPQKEALSLRVPLHHNESDYLEPRGRGKYWPSIKLRDIKEINHLIPLIDKAYENRHNWEPYNE